MLTYEESKMKAVETIMHGAMAVAVTRDRESVKALARSIQDSAKLLMWLEDLQIAYEKGDLEAMHKAKTNNGF